MKRGFQKVAITKDGCERLRRASRPNSVRVHRALQKLSGASMPFPLFTFDDFGSNGYCGVDVLMSKCG